MLGSDYVFKDIPIAACAGISYILPNAVFLYHTHQKPTVKPKTKFPIDNLSYDKQLLNVERERQSLYATAKALA